MPVLIGTPSGQSAAVERSPGREAAAAFLLDDCGLEEMTSEIVHLLEGQLLLEPADDSPVAVRLAFGPQGDGQGIEPPVELAVFQPQQKA